MIGKLVKLIYTGPGEAGKLSALGLGIFVLGVILEQVLSPVIIGYFKATPMAIIVFGAVTWLFSKVLALVKYGRISD